MKMAHNLLHERVALITGAGQGLGQTLAFEFAAEGARVALIERNPKTLQETLAALHASGHASLGFDLDITNYAALGDAIQAVLARWQQIDILVNNAGIFRNGTLLENSLDDWRAVLAVNLDAVYMCSKLVAAHMVAAKRGRIINIASIAGFAARGGVGSYNASKGGVIALTKSMAVELAPHNIAVNAIAPGFMRTAMLVDDKGNEMATTPQFVETYINARRIPMARVGETSDVAGAAVFLASDYCRYMTGQVLVVDGGLTSTF